MASRENLTSEHEKLEIEDCDMFNALPLHLVCHILSYLTTDDAIKTSILSKRWRFRWTRISNLNLKDEKIYDPAVRDDDGMVIDEVGHNARIKCFIDYVNNVLLQFQSTSVDRFSILLDDCDDRLQIQDWISAAVKLNIRYLSLRAESILDNPIDLPGQVFECKSLGGLSLSAGVLLKIPKQGFSSFPYLTFLILQNTSICGIPANENSACFPKLETLHLRNVRYDGKNDCVMKLVRNCPVLKNLLISRRIQDDVTNIDMCIPVLTSVDLDLGYRRVGTKVEIEAPIKYLRVVNFNPTHKLSVKTPGSLITTDVRMSNIETEYYEAEPRVIYDFQGEQKDNVFTFMKTSENVKRLKLGAYTATVIRASQIELPLFCNLTRLEVELICKNLCVIHRLLNNCNKLQTLIIDKRITQLCCIEEEQLMEFSHVPECLLTSLKWVEIHGFDGCTHMVGMIKNVLKFAETLKKLTIKSGGRYDGDTSTLRRNISTFPRASAACVVDFFILVIGIRYPFWRRIDSQVAFS